MSPDESQLYSFLKDFKDGEFHKAIRACADKKRQSLMETLATPQQRHDDMIQLQGQILELKWDPVEALLDELEQKHKQKGE